MKRVNNIQGATEKKKAPPIGRSYPIARHHAWGGLAMLSLLWALRLLFPGIPDVIWVPIALFLVIYVLVWLFLTYRSRDSLERESATPPLPADTVNGERSARYKLEKKKLKAEAKAARKRNK